MGVLFYAMLIGASMVCDAVVVLDKPFRLLPDLRDGCFVTEAFC